MTNLLIKLFIRDVQDITSPHARGAYGKLGGFTGIVCNIFLFLIKLLIGISSGSIAIVADALNNLSDIGSSIVTLLGFKMASKPADREHPFGHGRMEYMSGFIVAIVIIVVGIELLKSAFGKIIHPQAVSVNLITFSVLMISILVKLWMSLFFRKLSRKINSVALMTTARDSINDVVATSAVLLTSILLYFTSWNIDGYVGVIVAGFIIYGGFQAAHQMLSPLLGEAPNHELVNELKKHVMACGDFVGVHDLIIHNYGPGRGFACLHVEVPANTNILACHELIDACEREVGHDLGLEIVIHMQAFVMDDERTNQVRAEVIKVVSNVDEQLSVHDFRMVDGAARTNLIFDVVMPYGFYMSDCELKDIISQELKKIDDHFNCVINIDNNYDTNS